MKLKSLLLLAVAMSCGLVAMLGVQQVLTGDDSSAEEGVKVLVATTDIAPGSALDESNVTFKEWPKDAIPTGAVTKKEEYANRAVTVRAVAGEIILKAKLGKEGEIGITSAIPTGMRLVAIQVDETMTHSGMLLPGNRVDVMVTYRALQPGIGNIKRIETVLENVEVFSIDNVTDGTGAESIKAKNISLQVTPEEANSVKLAESIGKLHLMLRPKGDTVKVRNTPFLSFAGGLNNASAEPTGEDEAGTNGSESKVEEFLDKQGDQKQGGTVEPAKPTWMITIHKGEEIIKTEVELPNELAAAVIPAPAGAATKPWINHLKAFFTSP